jgi:hypothetical protein
LRRLAQESVLLAPATGQARYKAPQSHEDAPGAIRSPSDHSRSGQESSAAPAVIMGSRRGSAGLGSIMAQ